MPVRKRVTGLPGGSVDLEKREANFTLAFGTERPIDCIAKEGALDQIIAGLAHMSAALRQDRVSSKSGGLVTLAAEKLVAVQIQRQQLHDAVILQVVTANQVPYTFAIPLQAAADIAELLKNESAKDVQVWRA